MSAPIASRGWPKSSRIAAWVLVAFALRVAAAFVVEALAHRRGSLCLFDDTLVYWRLGQAIRAGGPYVVSQFGVPHFALRAPGYPLFLAVCHAMFGESTLAARVVQAALGACGVWLLHGLTRSSTNAGETDSTPVLAGAILACEPFSVATTALLLSEAVFVPLMLAMLWGLSALWNRDRANAGGSARAIGVGVLAGAAILVRPSWLLFPAVVCCGWILLVPRTDRARALGKLLLVCLGLSIVMSPWWVRNAFVIGRFVPTALWAGASLYDGLNPRADGSSDMRFLAEPKFVELDEVTQDRVLAESALAYARAHGPRALTLAAIKAGRFWSLWPNEPSLRTPALIIVSACATLPLYVLIVLGVIARRRDVRALALLAGPLVYFAILHMVFVSSLRYRIPAMAPAFGLAAVGARCLVSRCSKPPSGDQMNRPSE